jgi:hypothetical protein
MKEGTLPSSFEIIANKVRTAGRNIVDSVATGAKNSLAGQLFDGALVQVRFSLA